jgi:hypothetical protein
MRLALACGAAFALAIPFVSFPTVGHAGAALPAARESGSAVSPAARLELAAVVGRRGVIVRGPRGRARVFAYRGRSIGVIRRPAFVWPPGYAYRRWRVHELLPVAFIAAPFFFLEYEALGLQAPPPGYHWVRYGPDLVLVNERTREIDEIVPDAVEDE